VGGCIVTSAEEFPEEQQVPPAVLDTPDLPIGTIIAYNQSMENEVRLGINVRDDNVDDVLQVQAKITVVGQTEYDLVCPQVNINSSGTPDREQFELVIQRTQIRTGACNRVDVYVSRDFVGNCSEDRDLATRPRFRGDLAHGLYWVWETSGDPVSNGAAARDLVNSCQTIARTTTPTSMPIVQ
jgi:hypothetical protein